MLLNIAFLGFFISSVLAEKCPQGGEIHARGLTQAEKDEILSEHNRYRLMIARGQVPGQPRGINLKRMVYDEPLGEIAKVVSNTCKAVNIYGEDERFDYLGQNIHTQWSNEKSTSQNWTQAIESWFNEHKDFIYPDQKTRPDADTDQYTQLVWADSTHVGCDFIAFYEPKKRKHAQMYTCNYGPGGNEEGAAPYLLDCPALC